MRECVCAPVTMPGGAHHSAGLSPEHMGSCPEGLSVPSHVPHPRAVGPAPCRRRVPLPPARGPAGLALGPSPPDAQFQPEGGGCVFCLGLFLSFGGSY